MAKSTSANLIAAVKRRWDYDITDSDLDTLILDMATDSLRQLKQWLTDYGLWRDISASSTFQLIEAQEYRDITYACITGDVAEWTGVAGDTIDVNIDGTAYADIDVSGDTDISEVVDAINAATSGTQASETTGGFLQIKSATSGSTSQCTIADGTTGNSGEAERLFSVAADRTDTGIADLDEINTLTERTNDTFIEIIPFRKLMAIEPDPTSAYGTTPQLAARWDDKIYFRPTPSTGGEIIYIDYIQHITALTSSSTLPTNDKYDPILVAMVIRELEQWKNGSDANAITIAQNRVDRLRKDLISGGATNLGQVWQSAGRNDPVFWGPRVPES